MSNTVCGRIWNDAQVAELRYWEERKRWCEGVSAMLDYLAYLAKAFEFAGSVLEKVSGASCLEVGVGPFGIGSLVFHARKDARIVAFDPLPKISISCSDSDLNAY